MNQLRVQKLATEHIGPIDLEIPGGQCVILSGVSGSGKTLFLRAIADLDAHTGKMHLDGAACNSMTPTAWRQQVGLLAAESQWWDDSVGDHFKQEATPQLDKLGFGPDVMAWKISRLSSGERQRLALVRLLINKPKVLLLDEPTANLDSTSTKNVEALIKQYQKETCSAILWVSHQRDQIDRIADRHLFMVNGQLQKTAP